MLRADLGNLLAYIRSSRGNATRRELGEPRQRSLELVLLVGDMVPSLLSTSDRHCRDHVPQRVAARSGESPRRAGAARSTSPGRDQCDRGLPCWLVYRIERSGVVSHHGAKRLDQVDGEVRWAPRWYAAKRAVWRAAGAGNVVRTCRGSYLAVASDVASGTVFERLFSVASFCSPRDGHSQYCVTSRHAVRSSNGL